MSSRGHPSAGTFRGTKRGWAHGVGALGSASDTIRIMSSSSRLIRPRSVFFDTNHLIAMTKIRMGKPLQPQGQAGAGERLDAYRRMVKGIGSGAIQPVIAFEQPYEWGAGAEEIAEVLDQSSLCREVVTHSAAFTLEALAEVVRLFARRRQYIPSPIRLIRDNDETFAFFHSRVPMFRNMYERSGMGAILPSEKVGSVDARPYASVRDMVRTVRDAMKFQLQSDAVSRSIFEWAFHSAKVDKARERNSARECVIERLQSTEPFIACVLSLGLQNHLPEFWRQFDLERCPSLSLWSQMWWRYVSGKTTPKPGDEKDVTYLPAYCYADFSLTEKQMYSFIKDVHILQRRVFAEPGDLAAALDL